jgi:hypothetical protein
MAYNKCIHGAETKSHGVIHSTPEQRQIHRDSIRPDKKRKRFKLPNLEPEEILQRFPDYCTAHRHRVDLRNRVSLEGGKPRKDRHLKVLLGEDWGTPTWENLETRLDHFHTFHLVTDGLARDIIFSPPKGRVQQPPALFYNETKDDKKFILEFLTEFKSDPKNDLFAQVRCSDSVVVALLEKAELAEKLKDADFYRNRGEILADRPSVRSATIEDFMPKSKREVA